ncbi:cell division protein FtsK [Kutzneria sp. NPDC051319]|uniref:cell division protein FtsK n=1 Tax=Kutzneria sp. NPDC051319 TaxID=3155047 RepID=UPI00344A9A09
MGNFKKDAEAAGCVVLLGLAIGWLIAKLIKTVLWLLWKGIRHGLPALWEGCKWLNRHPRTTAILLVVAGVVTVGWVLRAWHVLGIVGLAFVGVAALVGPVLAWRAPVWFETWVWRWVRSWWLRWVFYAPRWESWARGCGLVIVDEATLDVTSPVITKVSTGPAWDEVRVSMAVGQKTEDYEERVRELAHARRSARCVIRELAPGVVSLDFQRRDLIAGVVPAAAIAVELLGDAVDLSSVPVGVSEFGRVLRMPLFGRHTFCAAETGAGKNSFTWAPYRVLAPAVRDGLVRVSGIDPKGMELAYGRGLFHRYADKPADALELLEELVACMNERKLMLAGRRRKVTISRENPLEVLEFDEIAALTKYLGDKGQRARIEALVGLLLTQGRSLGFVVRGYVQEPTKETVVWRELFPFRMAMALPTASYVDMVLGDGAYERGARADRISADTPGVGYMLEERRRVPVRGRIAWTDDAGIEELVAYVRQPARGGDVVDGGRVVEFVRRNENKGGEAA